MTIDNMIRARSEGCTGHRRGVLGEASWTRLSLPVSRCDPGSTSQNYISYPWSPFVKLHCKLCWPYRFFHFSCKSPLFFPRCSAVKLKKCTDYQILLWLRQELSTCCQCIIKKPQFLFLAFKTHTICSQPMSVSSHISNYLPSYTIFPATYFLTVLQVDFSLMCYICLLKSTLDFLF